MKETNHADPVVETIPTHEEMPDPKIPTPKKGEEKKEAPHNDHVTVRLSRRFLWSLGITVVILGLGVSAWHFHWYQDVKNAYNTTSFSLKVKEGDKFALQGATVTLADHTYTTDTNGKVGIERIVAGTYAVKISKDGYTPLQQSVTIHRGDNDVALFSLQKIPEKLYTLSGTVRNYVSAAALVDAQVTVDGRTVQTDPSGGYSFDKLAPADYTLTISKAGYISAEVKQTIKGDLSADPINLVPVGQVVFVSNRDGKRALYVTNYDGSQQQKLVDNANSEDYSPMLSPDGQWVAFSSTRDNVTSSYGSTLDHLYIVGRDGKELKKISDDVGRSSYQWSPKGNYLYYEGYADTALTQSVRRFYDVGKGSTFDLGEEGSQVTFAPSGSLVAYATQANGLSTIKTLNITTGERKQVAQKTATYVQQISFTTDGTGVIYSVMTDQGVQRYQVQLDSLQETTLAAATTSDQRTYITSPSGVHKVFVEERDGKKDVFMVDKDNSNEKRLTTLGVVSDQVEPIWDITSQYVIFAVQREGENALYVVSAAGGDPKKVTDFLAESTSTGGL